MSVCVVRACANIRATLFTPPCMSSLLGGDGGVLILGISSATRAGPARCHKNYRCACLSPHYTRQLAARKRNIQHEHKEEEEKQEEESLLLSMFDRLTTAKC